MKLLTQRLGNIAVDTSVAGRRVMAHDASHFYRVPVAVVTAQDAYEVQRVMAAARELQMHLTFRSGGTSLSGQGTTDGLLLDTRRGFRQITVLDDGHRVRVQPGATVRGVNNRLRRFGTKLGPDPASEIACTIGGVIANNSSGMTCGTEFNTYQTIESLEFILPSGTKINSADPDAAERLAAQEPDLVSTLTGLRAQILANPNALAHVRAMFSMKNTMGYGLNALVDFSEPLDILVHLLVGSEGTLAFVTEAVFRTIAIHAHAMTGFLVFDSLFSAANVLPTLVAAGASAIELMDATSLRVAQQANSPLPQLKDLVVDHQAALLVEFEGPDLAALTATVANLAATLPAEHLVSGLEFAADQATRAQLWQLRKGLYTMVAGARPAGTTALLEDVVVPVAQLAQTCFDLELLFKQYGYRDAVIFGHAKDGNIHFMLTDDFEDSAAHDRFARFTDELVNLILAAGGSLKAEHGTGHVMAPFVRRQYGEDLYRVMTELKAAFDPNGLLNPGVILTADQQAHLKDFKPVAKVHEAVDNCVECGYCEPVCPSKDLTLTPRQRIVLSREVAQAEAGGDQTLVKDLRRGFTYDVINTCAVDGMCQTACPVNINTGDLVRTLRQAELHPIPKGIWNTGAKHWGTGTRVAAAALNLADKLPPSLVRGPLQLSRKLGAADTVPLYSADLPTGGTRRSAANQGSAHAPVLSTAAIYLPSCQGAMFAGAGSDQQPPRANVMTSLQYLCELAGITLLIPDQIDDLCCGTPWQSKGATTGYTTMTQKVLGSITGLADLDVPVITDSSSCAEGLTGMLSDHGYTVMDPLDFVAQTILDKLPVPDTKYSSLTIHPTCSTERLGSTGSLSQIAGQLAHTVEIPADWGCCGFAGDRGMLHPELTASATQRQSAQVQDLASAAHASSNRACEIAMSRATGYEYQNIVQLLAHVHGLGG